MAKQSNNGTAVKLDDNEEVEGVDYVITSKKKRVDLTGVSPTLLQKLQSAGTLPDVPYRETPTVFGENQKEPLTENDLQTDEEKAQWATYISERNTVLAKRHNDFIRAIFAKGTSIDESKIEEWKKEQQEEWGLEVPVGKVDTKVAYIQDELVGTPDDIVNIVTGVLAKVGAPPEAIEEARTMFRGSIRRNPAP